MSIVDDLCAKLEEAAPEFPEIGRVLRLLVQNHRGAGTVYPISVFAGLEAALPCLAVFTNLEPPFLARRWTYCDPHTEEQLDLEEEEVRLAEEADEFFHPLSGEPVLNFREVVHVSLLSAPALDTIVQASRNEK